MAWFAFGFLIGGCGGVLLVCLLQMAGREPDEG